MTTPALPTDHEGLRPAGEAPRILIAGIGNVFLGDDGFGVAVVEQLARFAVPHGAVLMDAGIRGLDLTYALLGDYDAAILIDAMRRGYAPGSLSVLDPEVEEDREPEDVSNPAGLLDAHAMDPMKVLAFVRQSGSKLRALRVLGCEPLTVGSDDEPAFGLSAPVRAAVSEAAQQVYALVAELQRQLREPVQARGERHA
jgi:hydrogenase maturation protease